MNLTSGLRKTANLSESNLQRLNMYAFAASAAGVGVLALTQAADAKVVYTPVHHVIGRNERYKVSLNHGEIGDLTFVNRYGCNQDYCEDALSAIPSAGNAVAGKLTVAYALVPGVKIGPKEPFSGKIMAFSSSSEGTFGQWANVSNRYLGLKFNIKGKAHYGWLRLTVRLSGHARITATLTGYAYETIPGKAIKAGQTKEADALTNDDLGPGASLTSPIPDTPQPSSLGMLALGAPGVPLWRGRKRKKLFGIERTPFIST
jgi:hypothetical protein